METRLKGLAAPLTAVTSAYILLIVIWIISIEFNHTYQHWLENTSLDSLPVLTIYALPLIGFEGDGNAGSWLAKLLANGVWFVLAAAPALFLFVLFRSSAANRFSVFLLFLFTWLCLVLASTFLVALGLWLPFSLL